ncbi:MAG: hypothetical protein ACRDNS_32580, partial [Trebonia sp.]
MVGRGISGRPAGLNGTGGAVVKALGEAVEGAKAERRGAPWRRTGSRSPGTPDVHDAEGLE